MARWKLMTAHYINLVTPTEWEHQEISRSGDPVRKRFVVPRLLDPKDPKAWNNVWGHASDPEGEIVVCRPGKGELRDYAFETDPTPDMMPLDEEAREISARFSNRWEYKPEDALQSHSQSLIDRFEIAMADKAAAPTEVNIPGLEGLVAIMAKQQETLAALVANQPAPATTPGFRR